MESWRRQFYHSAKGSVWSNHKYIAIQNGRYIYPEDVKDTKAAKKIENNTWSYKTAWGVSSKDVGIKIKELERLLELKKRGEPLDITPEEYSNMYDDIHVGFDPKNDTSIIGEKKNKVGEVTAEDLESMIAVLKKEEEYLNRAQRATDNQVKLDDIRRKYTESKFAHIGKSKLDGAKIGSGRYPLGSGKNPRAGMKPKASFSLFGRKRTKETHNYVDKDARNNYNDDTWEERKKEAVRTGDVKFVSRYIDDFEPKQISETNTNYGYRKTLKENLAKTQKQRYSNILNWMEKTTSTMKKINAFTEEIGKGAKFISAVTGTKLPKFDLDESSDGKKDKKKKPDNHIKQQVNQTPKQQPQQNNKPQQQSNQKKDPFKEAGITVLTPDEYYNAKLIEALSNSSGGSSGWSDVNLRKWKNYSL